MERIKYSGGDMLKRNNVKMVKIWGQTLHQTTFKTIVGKVHIAPAKTL